MVRPFFPGGDFEAYDYPDGSVVVDNPPFSILTKIIKFYIVRGIRFFLFAPSLTCISSQLTVDNACAIPLGADVVYANGAEVKTGFVTNLETEICLKSEPELYKRLDAIAKAELKKTKKQLPKYSYPDHVVTAAMVQQYSSHGVPYQLDRKRCRMIRALDSQRAVGKSIFGGGLLLSEKAAAEKAAAEKAAAEKAAATRWTLSFGELDEIRRLSEGE